MTQITVNRAEDNSRLFFAINSHIHNFSTSQGMMQTTWLGLTVSNEATILQSVE